MIAKNKTDTTLNQIHDFIKAGYKEAFGAIMYHIDDDHDILHRIKKISGPFSRRDQQIMTVRFRIMNHKLLNGIENNIVGMMWYDTSKSHVLYIEPPQYAIRTKCEGQGANHQQHVMNFNLKCNATLPNEHPYELNIDYLMMRLIQTNGHLINTWKMVTI